MQLISFGKILARYLAIFPEERSEHTRLAEFLQVNPQRADQIRRNNMGGHLTVGGIVLNAEINSIILIRHPFLEKFLPPGGHIEPADLTPVQGAVREIVEETGLARDQLELIPMDDEQAIVPIDINSHSIPANDVKGEGIHWHHDLRYLFRYLGASSDLPDHSPETDSQLQAGQVDTGRLKWCKLGEAFRSLNDIGLGAKIRSRTESSQ